MPEYLVVHRAGEIYKLRFQHTEPELYHLVSPPGIFYAIIGWEYERVRGWLEERGFKYYWEKDND